MNTTELLFSYGTLQNTSVQLSTFGRKLDGFTDELLDYRLEMLQIHDQKVLELSAKTHHPIAILSPNNTISGVVFAISKAELVHSDKYEVAGYKRVIGQLASGKQAWVYVQNFKN